MSNYIITGIVYTIEDTQVFKRGFKKRNIIIKTSGTGDNLISIEVHGDMCEVLDDYAINDVVEIHFKLIGREWTSPDGNVKYFTSLKGYRIDKLDSVDSVNENFNIDLSGKGEDLPF